MKNPYAVLAQAGLAVLLLFFLSIPLSQNAHAQSYNFDNLTAGASGALPNGWTATPSGTTSFRWQADSMQTPSQGTGPFADHTTGTTTGMYMYTEANFGATGNSATLESPVVNLAGFTEPRFSFWFHKVGTSQGGLFIDVFSGGSWVLNVDSVPGSVQTSVQDPWIEKRVNLTAYAGTSIRVRFRAIRAATISGDMAIDDVSFVEAPAYDAAARNLGLSIPFHTIPQQQVQAISFFGDVENVGYDTLNDVTGTVEVNPGGFSTSSQLSNVLAETTDPFSFGTTFSPTTSTTYDVELITTTTLNDTVGHNDTINYEFAVSDSVYARERGDWTGGIGFTGATGFFGQSFEIFATDTLTGISVNLQSPTAGDSIRFIIYDFTGGVVGAGVDTSAFLVIPSSAPNWYPIFFPCDIELAVGQYFVAVEQANTNNLGFGFSTEYYEANQLFFSTTGTAWTPFESAGFSVTLGLRLILGTPKGGVFTFDAGPDTTYCPADPLSYNINAFELDATYAWNTGATTPSILADTAGTYIVTVSKCGISRLDTVEIVELPSPQVDLGPDTAYCQGSTFSLSFDYSAVTGATYQWSDGTTIVPGSMYTITSAGVYAVTGTLGTCVEADVITVQELDTLLPIELGPDSFYCEGTVLFDNLDASSPNATYNWSTGATTPNINITQPGTYSVTISIGGLCADSMSDAITYTEVTNPVVALVDTFFCTGGGTVILDPGAFTIYRWSTGDTTPTIEVSAVGNYSVTVEDQYGCVGDGSATIGTRPGIVVSLGPDTSFYQPITLDAGGGFASYLWSTGDITQTTVANTTGTYWVQVFSSDGCPATDTIQVTVALSVDELTASGWNVYPNPNAGMFFLENEGIGREVHLQVYSLTGARIWERSTFINPGERMPIELDGAASGWYVLSIQRDDQVILHRFVVR